MSNIIRYFFPFTVHAILFLIFSTYFPAGFKVALANSLDYLQPLAEVSKPPAPVFENGLARIIVKVSIPNFKSLSNASTFYTGLATDKKNMYDADEALYRAINQATENVVARLPDQAYNITRNYRSLPLIALQVTPEALQRLAEYPNVEEIYPDIRVSLPEHTVSAKAENITELNRPTVVNTVDLIGVRDVWAKGYTGAGWYVAIIDTGIHRTHEFFQSKNIVEACFSADNQCPNNQRSMFGNGAAVHHPSMYDGYDHGTHVAGIAVGHKADGTLSGVAKDANIIAINVFSKFSADECGGTPCLSSYISDIIAALDYVYSLRGSYNIGAVNMSLGTHRYGDYCDSNTPITTPINLLRTVNIPTAVATGNDGWCGSLGAPSCISSSIAVMASTKTDQETLFNNWHATIGNLFAPGKDIYSATGDSNSSYAFWDGTSMATPHVAGGLTLMRQNQPTASPSELLSKITKNSPLIQTLCPDGGKKPRIYLKIETGSLQVTIEPASVRDAGAQWLRMETQTWRNSGDTEIHVPVGAQRVVFSRIDGWTRPTSVHVTINADQTATVTGTYIETPEQPVKKLPGIFLLLLDK